jgi:hypothetical protein
MHFYALIVIVLWPISGSAFFENPEPRAMPCTILSMPDDVWFEIVAEMSSGYWLENLVNLLTCCKATVKFLTDDTKLPFWHALAAFNVEQNGYDDYCFKKFTTALSNRQVTLARLLMGYGGIVIKDYTALLENAKQQGNNEGSYGP